jgi:asparagine synthase (glutamine-hydrolysing)
MCGICGVFSVEPTAGLPEWVRAVEAMAELMARRGPDDSGTWVDPDGHLALGFRRLAILDLTAAGHQPMVSGDGRSVLVFNGEIYNHQELRRELEGLGVRFRSRTDTEVLLEALNHWGATAIPRLNGMFAFAWYRIAERRLILARDHAGIKPLYYLVPPSGGGVAFASQFNALLRTPLGEPGPLRGDVLRIYLTLHHIPPPYGPLANTRQLEPGHYVEVQPDGTVCDYEWWSLPREAEPTLRGREALKALDAALDAAVRRQRVADVPLGVFLSGGIDSPLVAAVARRQAGPGLLGFTVGSPGWGQDESAAAAAYADRLAIDLRLRESSDGEALKVLPEVVAAQHEPFADFSILPTLMVSRFARSEVTVALSGDGGDELFFGYERPLSLLRSGGDFRWPWPVRLALYLAGKRGLGPRRSDVITSRSPGDYYYKVNSRLGDTDLGRLAPGLPPLPGDFGLYRFGGYRGLGSLAVESRRAEYYGQLQRGLKKVDMASMHHSLEVRVPLLDREVVDVSLRIDPFHCMRDGQRKAPLRDLLAARVPRELIQSRKLGFSVPLGQWLRGALRPVVEQTLLEGPLYPEGLFDRRALRRYVAEHMDGVRDRKWGLWTLLCLQWWYQTHARRGACPV